MTADALAATTGYAQLVTRTTDAGGTRSALVLVGAGATAGFLSGLFGVGGGLIMVPALVLLVGMAQHRAHATSLAAIVPIAVVGASIFGRTDNVNLVAAGLLVVGSLLGVQAGTRLMDRLSSERLALVFGGFVLVVAVAMLLS
jgi:uncharacterized membrane protein YfcA